MARQRVEALVRRELLRWARSTSGLSVADMARKVGTKEERILAWEAGNGGPGQEMGESE